MPPMSEGTFSGVVADGRFLPDLDHWTIWLREHEGRRVVITADTERMRTSGRARRYYFGVVVREFRDLWSQARVALRLPPYTKDEVHSVLVQVLVGSEPGPLPGSVLAVRTRDMDSKRFAQLVDDARHLALHDYGVLIPEPGEQT